MKEKVADFLDINLMAYLKAVVGISLLFILIYQVDFRKILSLLSKINLLALLVAISLGFIALLLSALRWQIILKAQGYSLPLIYLFLLYLEGLFFNNFLPSSIGGDAVRFAELGGKIKNYPASFSSVLGERILSSATLGIISFASAALMYQALKKIFYLTFIFMLACFLILFLFFYVPELFLKRTGSFLGNYRINDVAKELAKFRDVRLILKVGSLSLLFQLMLILMNWSIFWGLGVNVKYLYYFTFVPIIQAASMLPVSFNGIGVREGSYILLFGYAGLSNAISLTAALIFLMVVTFLSLGGGLVFAFKR